MNRVKIDLPELFSFTTRIPIRITDINYGNHAGNQVFLELLHEARVRYLSQFGYSELNLEGIGLIMADAAIEFKTEILYGDEVEVSIAISNLSRVGFDLLYRVNTTRNAATLLAGKAKTGMICYNYDLKKVMALPEKVKLNLLGKA